MKKKWLLTIVMIGFLILNSVSACAVDVDLSSMSGTVVYAQVFSMMNDPRSYLGQTVRMTGTFAVAESIDRNYYACLIADATACCAQGIEFITRDERTYPQDYPELGSIITVEGIFDIYEEDGYVYSQLIDATLIY